MVLCTPWVLNKGLQLVTEVTVLNSVSVYDTPVQYINLIKLLKVNLLEKRSFLQLNTGFAPLLPGRRVFLKN